MGAWRAAGAPTMTYGELIEENARDMIRWAPWERTNRIPWPGEKYPLQDTWEEIRDLADLLHETKGLKYTDMIRMDVEELRSLAGIGEDPSPGDGSRWENLA